MYEIDYSKNKDDYFIFFFILIEDDLFQISFVEDLDLWC